ncbi:LysR family transcriptional regulator [Frankia sp. AiPs1]|uniref:LysR family transcriptional regulator n=1 Tax=Frankia sp. AiPa1 TaxID=573492 RepID=UPI00202B8916|nr:LysR family transcriptional regulator [Frankia sp. AiPa1]MCL9760033.1 LysR family transcriptional regulator [Frankia sp. AiPa1]
MELRQLRTFEAVARTLSITQAARELHYAQSSVSDQVQALERDLGTPLLDRTRHRIRLTVQGRALADYAGRIFGLVEEARFAVAQPNPDLAVGALETLSAHLLPDVLARYCARHPGARVRVAQASRGELYQQVRRGELDACLTFGDPPPDASLRARTLSTEPLVVIVAPAHPLAGRGRASLADLAAEPFIATEPGCGFREMHDNAFAAGRVVGTCRAAQPVAVVSSIGTLRGCVAAGMGCALLPLVAVRANAERGEVALVELDDIALDTAVTLTWLARNAAHPGLLAFRAVLGDHLAEPAR